MSTRNETDNSTGGANKRVRIQVEDTTSNVNTPAASGGDNKQPLSCIELARKQATSYIESLPDYLRTRLTDMANDTLNAYATYYRKNLTYVDRKNNPDIIPGSAQISITLSVVKGVEEEPGFQALAKRTAEVVNQCRKLLREPIIECTGMNVEKLLSNVQQIFVKSLPDIAEIIVDDVFYGVNNNTYGKHQAIADFMNQYANDVLPCVKLHKDTFETKYCEVHQLDKFPNPLIDPSTTRLNNNNSQSAAAQGDTEITAEHIVGGTTSSTTNEPSRDGQPQAAQTNEQQPSTVTQGTPAPASATATATGGTETTDNAQPTSLEAAANLIRLQTLIRATLSPAQLETLDSLDEDQRAVMLDVMGLSLSNTFSTGVPPENPYETPRGNTNRAIQNINAPRGGDNNNDQAAMDTTADFQNTEEGRNNNNSGGGGGDNNILFASQLFNYEQSKVVLRKLLATIKGAFVNPINLYVEQDRLSKRAAHLKLVAKKQKTIEVADKTAEAIAEEAAVDPKIVKVMIQDSAEAAVKKLTQQKQKKKNNKQQQKNKSGGGTDTTASTTNQSSQPSNSRSKSPRRQRGGQNPGRGGNNQDQGRGRGRGRAGRGSSGGRGRGGKQSSNTSQKKSKDGKQRGRSKSPGPSRGK